MEKYNLLKPVETINLPKFPTLLGNFCKGFKINHFLVKSFLDNFYRHLAIFSGHAAHCFYRLRRAGRVAIVGGILVSCDLEFQSTGTPKFT